MMYSATLLVSLLASAQGFGSTPIDPPPVEWPRPVPPVKCHRDGRLGEKFFVYSLDMTQILRFSEAALGTLPENVTYGLIGKTWEGVELNITQGTLEGGDHIQIFQDDNGGNLLMPSPNTELWSFLSGDFCLPNGNWTVKVNSPKYTYLNDTLPSLVKVNGTNGTNGTYEIWTPPGSLGFEFISYKPILDLGKTLNVDLSKQRPFSLEWAIFPAAMREEAEAAQQDPVNSALNFIAANKWYGGKENVWASCTVNFTQNYWVPAPDHTCWEHYGYLNERNYPQDPVLTPEQGPCPRPEPGSGDEDNLRRLSFDESEPEVSTCGL